MIKAKVGDKVRIINAKPYGDFFYRNNDIFYVSDVWENGEGVDVGEMQLYTDEFEVVTGEAIVTEAVSLANLTARVSELESIIKRIKEALAND